MQRLVLLEPMAPNMAILGLKGTIGDDKPARLLGGLWALGMIHFVCNEKETFARGKFWIGTQWLERSGFAWLYNQDVQQREKHRAGDKRGRKHVVW